MHVIYLHTHDSGRILGPYGYQVHTPYLNEFAKDATLFRQAYCVSPTCSPSRAAMLTGCYPHENGMLGLAQRGFQLDLKKHLVPFLNAHGYHSVLCGIQHEAGWYLDHEDGAKKIGYHEDLTTDAKGYEQEEMTIWDQKNAQQVVSYLASYDQKKTLFLSFGMYATHRRYPKKVDEEIDVHQCMPPYPIPDTAETREDYARYLTSAKSADQCVGEIINALKQNGMYEDAIIIFTTDHGLANPFSKCTLFDSGIGVSFLMRLPNAKTKGKAIDTMISQIDVFPTLCDLLQLEKPKWLRGISFANCFYDELAEIRKELFAEVNFHTSYEPIRCLRTKRFKYIRYYDKEYLKINLSNIDESQTKTFFMEHELQKQSKYQEAVYDLLYDIGERNNIVEDKRYEKQVAHLREIMDAHMQETRDPLLQGTIAIRPEWKVNKKECQVASSKDPKDYISLGK